MIKIGDIKKQKSDRYKIEVTVNDEVVKHIITENTIIKHNLLTKNTLTKEEYNRIIKDNEYELLYLKAIHFISYQMRTISEVKKNLRKDTLNETLINKIITELKRHKYVDDLYYVTQYVKEKREFDLVGPRNIKEKLVKKGIHFDLIDEALRTKGFSFNIIESALLSSKDLIEEMIDENALIMAEINKLKGKYDLNKYEEKNKLIKKLMLKGYHYEIIKSHLK